MAWRREDGRKGGRGGCGKIDKVLQPTNPPSTVEQVGGSFSVVSLTRLALSLQLFAYEEKAEGDSVKDGATLLFLRLRRRDKPCVDWTEYVRVDRKAVLLGGPSRVAEDLARTRSRT